MRLWTELYIRWTSDRDQRQSVLGPARFVNDEWRQTGPASTGPSPGSVIVPAGAVNFPCPFCSVTRAANVLVIARGPVKYRLGAITAPLLRLDGIPADTGAYPYSDNTLLFQPGIILITTTNLAELYFTNPSLTDPVTVEAHFVGEGQP